MAAVPEEIERFLASFSADELVVTHPHSGRSRARPAEVSREGASTPMAAATAGARACGPLRRAMPVMIMLPLFPRPGASAAKRAVLLLLLLLAGCAATLTPSQRWSHETFGECRAAAPTAVLVELRENGFVTARADVTELARLERCWLDRGGWSRHREPQRPPGPSGVEIQIRVGAGA